MSIVIFIIILAVLVLIHEAGHFWAARKSGVKVEEFGFGFPPRLFGIKKGETLYSFNLIPLGGFVKVYGEEYHEDKKIDKKSKERAFVYKKPWQKAFIIIAGIVGNFVLAWAIISFLLTLGVPVAENRVLVQEVESTSPAASAGLQPKDEITQIIADGKEFQIGSVQELVGHSTQFAGQEITLKIRRGNTQKSLAITPRKNPPGNEGPLGIAITQPTVEKKYAWYIAPLFGFIETANRTGQIVVGLFQTLGQLITLQKPSVEVAGPIGIAVLTGEIVQFGYRTLLEFVAILSLNLAVINILPIPALDGGRLSFVLYEWISRRRINKQVEQYANIFGILLLLSLAIVVSVSDIAKIFR